jgi:hypothetical protein
MKLSFKIAVLFIGLFFLSCKPHSKNISSEINGTTLQNLVEKTLEGDSTSGKRLEGLFTFTSSDFNTYSKILIDSIKIDDKNYYSLIVQNENPLYNLFAVIDNSMNLLLKDESLNGYLNSNWKKSGSKIFAIVNENFSSKDVVNLKRVSFYQIDSLAGNLVFRQFTKIKTPDFEANQNITSISDSVINTEIIKMNPSSSTRDLFRFDVIRNKYLSNNNKFSELVKSNIESIKTPSNGLEISGVESIHSLLGLESDSTTIDSFPTVKVTDFNIKLDNQWRKLGNFIILDPLKKTVKGLKFINPKIGAEISIFNLSPKDSVENYFDQKPFNFDKINKIRVTDEFTDGKNNFVLYEYSCPDKKIILIFKAPKNSFDNYKDIYSNIIKSFKVNC